MSAAWRGHAKLRLLRTRKLSRRPPATRRAAGRSLLACFVFGDAARSSPPGLGGASRQRTWPWCVDVPQHCQDRGSSRLIVLDVPSPSECVTCAASWDARAVVCIFLLQDNLLRAAMSAAAVAVAKAVAEVERLTDTVRKAEAKAEKAEAKAEKAEEDGLPEHKQAEAKAALAEAKAAQAEAKAALAKAEVALAKAELALAPEDEAAQNCLAIASKSWKAAVDLLQTAVETHKHLAAAGEPL